MSEENGFQEKAVKLSPETVTGVDNLPICQQVAVRKFSLESNNAGKLLNEIQGASSTAQQIKALQKAGIGKDQYTIEGTKVTSKEDINLFTSSTDYIIQSVQMGNYANLYLPASLTGFSILLSFASLVFLRQLGHKPEVVASRRAETREAFLNFLTFLAKGAQGRTINRQRETQARADRLAGEISLRKEEIDKAHTENPVGDHSEADGELKNLETRLAQVEKEIEDMKPAVEAESDTAAKNVQKIEQLREELFKKPGIFEKFLAFSKNCFK